MKALLQSQKCANLVQEALNNFVIMPIKRKKEKGEGGVSSGKKEWKGNQRFVIIYVYIYICI
jgi:hypothetical protein